MKREDSDLVSQLMAENKSLKTEVSRIKDDLGRVKLFCADVTNEMKSLNATLQRIGDTLPLESKLQKPFQLSVEGTLEDVITGMEEVVNIPLHLHVGDLAEEGISKIRQIRFSKTRTAHEHLMELLSQANVERIDSAADPQLRIVYVIGRMGTPPVQKVIITTRKRAAERGVLPDCFQVKG